MEGGRVKKFFRCRTKTCRKKLEFHVGMFSEGANLSSKCIFHLSYFWSLDDGMTHEQIARELLREDGTIVGPETISDWMNFLGTGAAIIFWIIQHSLEGKGKL